MEEKLLYIVKLVRSDESIIDLVETNDFNKAKKVWADAHKQWKNSVAERSPFLITKPSISGFITAFDPSLIREIAILPIQAEEKESNPYKDRMQRKGFSSTFPGSGQLTDGGYL